MGGFGTMEIGLIVCGILVCFALATLFGSYKYRENKKGYHRIKTSRQDSDDDPFAAPGYGTSPRGDVPPPPPDEDYPAERAAMPRMRLGRNTTTNYMMEFEDLFAECVSSRNKELASKTKLKELLGKVLGVSRTAPKEAVEAAKRSCSADLDRHHFFTILRLLSLAAMQKESSIEGIRQYPGGEDVIPPPRIDRTGDPMVRMVLPDPSVVPDLTPSFPISNYIISYELLYLECATSPLSPTCSAEKTGYLLDRALGGSAGTTVKIAKTCWKLAGKVIAAKDRDRFYMTMRFLALHQMGRPATLEALYAYPGGTWSVPPPFLSRPMNWKPARGYRGDDERLSRARKFDITMAPAHIPEPALLLEAPLSTSATLEDAPTPTPAPPVGPQCEECSNRKASRRCLDCELLYCEGCLEKRHAKGKLARHVFEEIGVLKVPDSSAARCPECHALSKLCMCNRDDGASNPLRCAGCGAFTQLCVCKTRTDMELCTECGGTLDLCNCAVFSPAPVVPPLSPATVALPPDTTTKSKRSKSRSKSTRSKSRSKSKHKRKDDIDSDSDGFGQLAHLRQTTTFVATQRRAGARE